MRKTIYISDDYDKVQQVALDKGKNFSRYVCELVVKDLLSEKENQYGLLIEEIKELKTMLSNGSVAVIPELVQTTSQKNLVDEEKRRRLEEERIQREKEEAEKKNRSKKLMKNIMKF